jgi:hypothetical protein
VLRSSSPERTIVMCEDAPGRVTSSTSRDDAGSVPIAARMCARNASTPRTSDAALARDPAPSAASDAKR